MPKGKGYGKMGAKMKGSMKSGSGIKMPKKGHGTAYGIVKAGKN